LRNVGRRERRELVGIGRRCDDLLELLNLGSSEEMLGLTLKYRMRLSQNQSDMMVSHWKKMMSYWKMMMSYWKMMVRHSAVKVQRTC
jgi:hypothetical protein